MNDALQIASLGSTFPTQLDRVGGASTTVQPSQAGIEGPSFADALKESGGELVNSLQNAEMTSMRGMKGEASAYEVASAIMEAEQQLKMATAVREKIVQSFLDITRMQI